MIESVLEFGAAHVNITPSEPIPLAGFAYRNNQPFSDVASDLYLKAFVFRIAGRTKCLLIADILWWPPETIATIREDVREQWGIEAADVLLHATHTHSAPQTSARFAPGLGLLQKSWQQTLLTAVPEVIDMAMQTLQPAQLVRFRGSSSVSMNRRIDKRVDHPTADWPEGMIDREVTTVIVQDARNHPLGALVHFACHPTILRGARVSAEFPGVVCDHLAEYLGDNCVVGYLQGCSGDIGPVTEHVDAQPTGSFHEVERIGHQLANDVIGSLRGSPERIVPDSSPGSLTQVSLPFAHIPSHDELTSHAQDDNYVGEWARFLLEKNQPVATHAMLEIQQFPLGTDLSIVGFNAEMVSHYGILAKSLTGAGSYCVDRFSIRSGDAMSSPSPGGHTGPPLSAGTTDDETFGISSNGSALPCGYSNGMIGYIVTDHQLKNGGYEVDESTKYFALPSRFAEGNQQLIDDALRQIL